MGQRVAVVMKGGGNWGIGIGLWLGGRLEYGPAASCVLCAVCVVGNMMR